MDNIVKHDLLFNNVKYSDVEFVLKDCDGNCVNIPANKAFLALRSSVFERMFYGELIETGRVAITDVSAEAFTEFLQFFYLTKVDLTTDNIGEVLKLIDKYDAKDFWPVCEAFMAKTLTESLACEYYELALSFDLSDDIKTKIEKLIGKKRQLVFGTNDESRPNSLVLANILKSDHLVGREVDIFNDLMAWTKAVLQQRNKEFTMDNVRQEVIGLLEHIRFPIMTSEELIRCFKEYPDLLPPFQMIDLISFVVHKQELSDATRYNTEKRQKVDIVVSDITASNNPCLNGNSSFFHNLSPFGQRMDLFDNTSPAWLYD